jgi:fatty acid desaturase
MTNAEYIRTLRPLLPPEAFRAYPRACIPIFFHVAVLVAAWIACRYLDRPYWPLAGLVVAISMNQLLFYAHDLSHRTIITNRYLLYPTELLVFSLLLIPPTLWRKVHGSHHAHTNAMDDPDRRFVDSELTPLGKLAAVLLFPTKVLRFFPAYMLYWVVFPLRHGITGLFYPGKGLPPFATAKPRYTVQDRLWIAFETGVVIAVQYSIYKIVRHGYAYFWVSIIPLLVSSLVVSWYELTNHGLKPIGDGNDILEATTTVTVPELCNRLHSNFSYHTEHHLFPTMNPRYYPLVSALFREHFPDRYHRVPIGTAWRGLWRNAIASPRRGNPTAPVGDLEGVKVEAAKAG